MTNVEEMRQLLDSDEYQMRFNIGLGQPSSSLHLSDLSTIVEMFSTHYSLLNVKAELDQMVEGLESMGVLPLIRSNPNKLYDLFVAGTAIPLSADKMIDMFTILFSPVGSNRREREDSIVLKWCNYLQHIEGSFTIDIIIVVIISCILRPADNNGVVNGMSHDGVPSSFKITFEDILVFATGSACEPPIGFDKQPTIAFEKDHTNNSPFPRANTCANVIYLSADETPYENFKHYISYGILNTAGFGLV